MWRAQFLYANMLKELQKEIDSNLRLGKINQVEHSSIYLVQEILVGRLFHFAGKDLLTSCALDLVLLVPPTVVFDHALFAGKAFRGLLWIVQITHDELEIVSHALMFRWVQFHFQT